MKYSIIIATYDRYEEIQELLDSAENLIFNRAEFEILFIDDGSKDNTANFIKSYFSQSGLQLRYFYQENKGPGAARNYGMSLAQGEYFIFVDSDCLFPENYLLEIDDFIQKNKPDAFGGPDTCHPSFSPLLKAINYSMTSFIGTGGTRGSKHSVQKKFYPRSFNMGLSKEVFNNIGGMGGLRHGQDMEFSARIYKNGYKVQLIPKAIVYHKRRTSLKRFYKQIFNWGVARINLGQLDKNMLKPIHLLPAFIVLGFVFLVLLTLLPFDEVIYLWIFTFGGMFAIALLAFIQSFLKYSSIKVSLLSIVTLYIQVFAYGAGLLNGIFQLLKGKKTVTGYTKNYYK